MELLAAGVANIITARAPEVLSVETDALRNYVLSALEFEARVARTKAGVGNEARLTDGLTPREWMFDTITRKDVDADEEEGKAEAEAEAEDEIADSANIEFDVPLAQLNDKLAKVQGNGDVKRSKGSFETELAQLKEKLSVLQNDRRVKENRHSEAYAEAEADAEANVEASAEADAEAETELDLPPSSTETLEFTSPNAWGERFLAIRLNLNKMLGCEDSCSDKCSLSRFTLDPGYAQLKIRRVYYSGFWGYARPWR